MHITLRLLMYLSFGLILALTGLGTALQSASAQDAVSYPLTINAGTCESPEAQPVQELGDAIERGQMEDAEMLGKQDTPVYENSETIDASFEDLTSSPHVVLVHTSPDQFGTYVACGDIGGAEVDGRLVVPVRPLESQVVGMAIMATDEGGVLGLGDDEFNVTVYLYHEGLLEAASGAGTPTPLPDQPTAETPTPAPTETPAPTNTPEPTQTPEETIELPSEATIELTDEGLNPQELTIPANFDFGLTLSNLTDQEVEFSVEGQDITETVPAGEVVTTTLNVEEGEYQYTMGDQNGTFTALPQAEG